MIKLDFKYAFRVHNLHRYMCTCLYTHVSYTWFLHGGGGQTLAVARDAWKKNRRVKAEVLAQVVY